MTEASDALSDPLQISRWYFEWDASVDAPRTSEAPYWRGTKSASAAHSRARARIRWQSSQLDVAGMGMIRVERKGGGKMRKKGENEEKAIKIHAKYGSVTRRSQPCRNAPITPIFQT